MNLRDADIALTRWMRNAQGLQHFGNCESQFAQLLDGLGQPEVSQKTLSDGSTQYSVVTYREVELFEALQGLLHLSLVPLFSRTWQLLNCVGHSFGVAEFER